jgi:hypothetical protein
MSLFLILCDNCAEADGTLTLLSHDGPSTPLGNCQSCGSPFGTCCYYTTRTLPRTPPSRRRFEAPGTPPLLQGVGLGGGFSPSMRAPAGESRRRTYVLEEDCPACYEQDKDGHRMCLRCNASCCNNCWFKMATCPICRMSKN